MRYYDPAKRDSAGGFGDGWSLLVPYRVELADKEYQTFRNARIPARMVVIDLVSGRREQLSFSEDRYAIAGWVPEVAAKSKLIGLFPLSDGSFRLADKLGVNAAFDTSGRLTDLALSSAYQVHFEQANRLLAGDFVKPPYALEPEGNETRSLGGASLPARLRLHGPRGDEILALRTDADILGYYPTNNSSPVRMAALLTNGQVRLVARSGDEIAFDQQGSFTAMLLREPVTTRLSQDKQSISFRFAVGSTGAPQIAEASNSVDPSRMVRYEYDAGHKVLVAAATN